MLRSSSQKYATKDIRGVQRMLLCHLALGTCIRGTRMDTKQSLANKGAQSSRNTAGSSDGTKAFEPALFVENGRRTTARAALLTCAHALVTRTRRVTGNGKLRRI